MRRPLKKAIILALSIFLVFPILPSCARGEDKDVLLGLGSYFPLQEPLELTAWVVNTLDSISVSDSAVLEWIKEKTNIDLIITREFVGADAKNRLNMAIETADRLPDILLCTRWTKAECALYGIRGIVIPLDDYLQSCENWNALTEICGQRHRTDLEMPDGHIYCYGTVNECFHLTHQARMWVYKPWIDSLCGGKMPETTEEFREYLRLVLTKDPNGNGLHDEIPLTGQIQEGWATDPFTFLSNSFVHNNTIFGSTNQTVASGCYIVDGKVHCNWVEDGYRRALQYANQLYKEGLMHSQVFTQNNSQLNARIKADPPIVGAVAAGFSPSAFDEPLLDESWDKWACLAPLEGPDGTRMSYQSLYDYFYNCNGLVTKDCQYPMEAVQLFDILASSEGTLVQNYGKEGVNWEWCSPEDGQGIDGATPLYRYTWENPETDNKLYWPSDVQICSNTEAFRKGALISEETFKGEDILYKCALLYEQFSPGIESVYPNIAYTEETAKQLINYQASIEAYVRQSTIQFIMGYMNLDSDWDAYLTMLDVLGQKGYERVLQEAYDAEQGHQ